ncbi:MAG: methionyl-tRNA formyltransferase [Acutalibacteraceae bacterium]|nr:methionyl-tRNA formyltransferase [Acutalibacteraceae bacterium]
MKVVFMGTPEFAVPCLQKLIDCGHEVTGVFTQPDKPQGRKMILTPPPVKELAVANGIKVYQPVKMKDGTALEMLREADPELCIVVAYGKILPKEILEYPKYGCINIHASLLPKLRGAAPIQWSVINGFDKTGVTSMQMDEGLDTGDMLIKGELEIGENETAGELHDRLSQLGAEVLEKTIIALEKGELKPEKQNHEEFTYASMLSKELSPIDWTMTAQQVHNKIRGLSPWPSANAKLNGKTVKIHRSVVSDSKGKFAGEVVEAGKKLVVACGDMNCIEILNLQAEGKKAMSAADFLRGNPLNVGDKFE